MLLPYCFLSHFLVEWEKGCCSARVVDSHPALLVWLAHGEVGQAEGGKTCVRCFRRRAPNLDVFFPSRTFCSLFVSSLAYKSGDGLDFHVPQSTQQAFSWCVWLVSNLPAGWLGVGGRSGAFSVSLSAFVGGAVHANQLYGCTV